jgi:hypothetical protein
LDTYSRLNKRITSSNFRGTSDSDVHSTDTVEFPPGKTIENAGEIINGPICNRPCDGASLSKD